jgi:WD40 repeat protein/nucleoside phosphorylase
MITAMGSWEVEALGDRHPEAHRVDVVIVVALEDELDAVLDEAGGPPAWRTVRDRDGLEYRMTTLGGDGGQQLGIAAAWAGAMGTTATAARAATLIRDLQPSCVAMCGICAGKRGEVALGDVIIADRLFSFDHGKLVAAHDGEPPTFIHDIATYNLERTWQMDAAAFRRDLGWAQHLLPRRPPAKDFQHRWVLHAIHAHEHEGGPVPALHPARAAVFPSGGAGHSRSDWTDRIRELREQKLVELVGGRLTLTDAGQRVVGEDRVLYPDGLPAEPPFRVHVGPIATGNSVVEDPQIFDRLKRVGRKILGIEMEASAIGYVGDALPRRAIVAKAVCDHGDRDKDDRFREFACRASAAWLLAFLRRNLAREPSEPLSATAPADTGPLSPFRDLPPGEARSARLVADESVSILVANSDGPAPLRSPTADSDLHVNDLHRRAKRSLALRFPDAQLAWKQGPPEATSALRAFLEVRTSGGGYTRAYPVAVIDEPLDRKLLEAFVERILTRYRADTPYVEGWMVYTGVAPADVIDEARLRGVRLESMLELQGLIDFRPYVAEQTRVLERDVVYPSRLYVAQRISYGTGRDERSADDALDALDRWLGDDGPQLLLVLGDFGTGKTFLMHELALRLGRRDSATVPILVELRRLEKARSLDALLGQHFVPDRGMKRFDYDAFRYMLEEGRIALLFDGFDELALRVTYETATEHLDTVLQAAIGNAKVVITSRTQHFLSDQQVMKALGERVTQRGFRMARLEPFDEPRIRRFLANRFDDDAVARSWFDLLGEVRDLLGLSHNPRMLSFIAALPEEDLRRAAEGGEITSATLYRVLLEEWLGHEVRRDHPTGIEPGLSAPSRWKAVTELAIVLWPRKERAIAVGEIPAAILDEVTRLADRRLRSDMVAHKLGSGTLLGRDEDGRFSFIHQSIVEWLVANAAAEQLRAGLDCELLVAAEMSDLMVDFLAGLTGREVALAWARRSIAAPSNEIATANASRVLRRLRTSSDDSDHAETADGFTEHDTFDVALDMSGQDLRGQDFSQTSYLREATLEDSNLSEALLARADLSGAVLARAKLVRANLERASLRGADLRGADLSFARLLGADLTGARLDGAKLRYAKLVGAKLDPDALQTADVFGAAPPHPGRFDFDRGLPVATCSAIAWSPDGAVLALGYRDGALVLVDVASGRSLRQLVSHRYAVNGIAFSPDGNRLASVSDDQVVRLWNPETGAVLQSLEWHSAGVTSIAFSPDGQYLASGSQDRTVALCAASDGARLHSLNNDHEVTCAAFSPNGKVLAVGSYQRTVLWSVEAGKRLRVLSGHLGRVTSVAFSPKGDLVVSGSVDRTVLLWNTQTGMLGRAPFSHPGPVAAVAFSPDGKVLITACDDGQVRLWSAAGEVIRRLAGTSRVCSMGLSPDGKLLATGSEDQRVQLWNLDTATQVRTLQAHTDWVNCIAFRSSKGFAFGSRDRTVRMWSTDVRPVWRMTGHSAWINSVAVSPDGRLLASGSSDGKARVSRAHSGRQVCVLEGHSAIVNSVAFSPDGKLLATGSSDTTVRVWQTSGAPVVTVQGHLARVNSVAFSPDSKLLASGSDDKTIQLWSVEDVAPVRLLRGHVAWVNCVAFSPDGKYLASGSEDKTVRLWNPATDALQRSLLEGLDACVTCIAFSPDSQLLAIGSFKSIQLWSPERGKPLRTLDGHSHWVNGVAFSPDGKLLATASSDCTIRLWSVAAALSGDGDPCLAAIVPGRRGWMAIAPNGRYQLGGDDSNVLGFLIGLCRFEPGELDAFPEAFDQVPAPRRIPDDEPLFTLDEPERA